MALFSLIMEGISSRHGGHHVAQKLSNTTLPFRSESFRGEPFIPLTTISGADCFSEGTTCFSGEPASFRLHATTATSATTANKYRIFFINPPGISVNQFLWWGGARRLSIY